MLRPPANDANYRGSIHFTGAKAIARFSNTATLIVAKKRGGMYSKPKQPKAKAMDVVHEAQGIGYELLRPEVLDDMAGVVANAFAGYEPTSVALGISSEEFVDYVQLYGTRMLRENLTIVATDLTTGDLVGALIADDLASGSPAGREHISEKFEPVLALLDELGEHYREGRDIVPGHYLHLAMLGVAKAFQNRGVGQNLLRLCLSHAADRSYRVAVAEATGTISQHILKDKFGFIHRVDVSYKTFIYRDKRIFASIEDHSGTVLMDRAIAPHRV